MDDDKVAMNKITSEAEAEHVDASERSYYSHQPLDHSQPSLRLVHVNEQLSKDGLVQCRIFHAPRKKRSYMCLSYVWDYSPLEMSEQDRASTGRNGRILLNGQCFEVRQNLLDFLRMAQREGTTTSPTHELRTKFDLTTPLWIDALCIDQTNTLERNHQVAQMGEIYRWAESVQVWLGTIPQSILGELQQSLEDAAVPHEFKTMSSESRLGYILDSIKYPWGLDEVKLPTSRTSFDQIVHNYILDNVYWTRAWIVQEVSLARKLTYWLHTSEIYDHLHLKSIVMMFLKSPEVNSWMDPSPRYFDHEFSDYPRDYKHDLIVLIDRFNSTSCANPFDRIFSLLSLCAPDTATFSVDYEMTAEELAYKVLSGHTGHLCICSVFVVMQALKNCHTSWAASIETRDQSMPWVEFDLAAPFCEVPFQSESGQALPQKTDSTSTCQLLYTEILDFQSTYNDVHELVTVEKASHVSSDGSLGTIRLALKFFYLMRPRRIRLCEEVKSMPNIPCKRSIRVGRGQTT